MPIDSTADLLFRIGANSDDAESNLVRFRSLLSKDMSDITGEFGDWSNKIIGQVTTLQGAVTAGAAVLAAGIVALAAFADEAANKYEAYVQEVARGSKTTGIAIGDMSGLKFAADATGTSYDALVNGLTKFATTIVKASEGGAAQLKMFERLGISQAQVQAGEKDMLPLLMLVADKFQGLGSQVDRTAVSRELFARGGSELVNFLSQGSAGIQKLTDKAKEMGKVLGVDDVNAMREHIATVRVIKEYHEALELVVGRATLPWTTFWDVNYAGAVKTALAMISWGNAVKFAISPSATMVEFTRRWRDETAALEADIKNHIATLGKLGKDGLAPVATAAKEAKTEFAGFAALLQEMRTKAADAGGAESKLTEEILKMQAALQKAEREWEALKAAGKESPAEIARQGQVYAATITAFGLMVPKLWAELAERQVAAVAAAGLDLRLQLLRQGQQTVEVQKEIFDIEEAQKLAHLEKEKTNTPANLAALADLTRAGEAKIAQTKIDAIEAAGTDIENRTRALEDQGYAGKVAAWNREVAGLKDKLSKEENLTAENEARAEHLLTAGLAKIDRDQALAFATEINKLAQHLEQIGKKHETAAQAIAAQYLVDLAKFGAEEEAKTQKTGVGEAERARIVALYAAIRAGLLVKEGQDLQTLRNSQGWQGVFGSQFASMIKGNEALTKEWASSTNQSLMMVRVTMESLKEMGQQTFAQFAQGMGSGIANAIVYSTSVGAAMRAALTATLESLASQALVYAIYSTGLGFLRLAEHDPTGATAAFTSAAIWGSIGAAAAVVGRAIAPAQGAAAASAGGSGSTAAGSSAAGSTGSAGQPGPHVTVNVQGHLVGWTNLEELTGAITDAVVDRSFTLTASNTTTGKQITR